MSGVAVVRYLLANNASLIAVVPATRIVGGPLALNAVLPALSVMSVDLVQGFLDVSMASANHYVVERVQVTAFTKDYASKKTILDLVRAALPHTRGSVNGILCDSILPDGTGPDLDDPEGDQIFTQSRDYIVKWNES